MMKMPFTIHCLCSNLQKVGSESGKLKLYIATTDYMGTSELYETAGYDALNDKLLMNRDDLFPKLRKDFKGTHLRIVSEEVLRTSLFSITNKSIVLT